MGRLRQKYIETQIKAGGGGGGETAKEIYRDTERRGWGKGDRDI